MFTSDAQHDGVEPKDIIMEIQQARRSIILMINNPLEFLAIANPIKNYI